MDLSSAERSAFKEEEVALILRNVIKDTLENETYDDDRVGEWINEVSRRGERDGGGGRCSVGRTLIHRNHALCRSANVRSRNSTS